MKPRLLDLFCGAGGCSVGYHRAGFDVVGVDLHPQKNYPYEFHQADALEVLATVVRCRNGGWFGGFGGFGGFDVVDAIHASPPCQSYSAMSACRPGLAESYADLVGATRDLLEQTGLPYVIENVPGSPLRDPVWLCGQMFGLELYRHRGFETNWPLTAPEHPPHVMPASKAGHWKPGTVMSVAGHVAPIKKAREVMGIDWMNRAELGESIPPAYTEYVGKRLMVYLERAAA